MKFFWGGAFLGGGAIIFIFLNWWGYLYIFETFETFAALHPICVFDSFTYFKMVIWAEIF